MSARRQQILGTTWFVEVSVYQLNSKWAGRSPKDSVSVPTLLFPSVRRKVGAFEKGQLLRILAKGVEDRPMCRSLSTVGHLDLTTAPAQISNFYSLTNFILLLFLPSACWILVVEARGCPRGGLQVLYRPTILLFFVAGGAACRKERDIPCFTFSYLCGRTVHVMWPFRQAHGQ